MAYIIRKTECSLPMQISSYSEFPKLDIPVEMELLFLELALEKVDCFTNCFVYFPRVIM